MGWPSFVMSYSRELVMKYSPECGSLKLQQLHHANGDPGIPIASALELLTCDFRVILSRLYILLCHPYPIVVQGAIGKFLGCYCCNYLGERR
jgi:hypothetical protein